jgi:putative peptidoglycan lipid II flippase
MLMTAGFMAFATFAAKALGLVRDSLMGAYFGTGIEADAFMAASKLPTTLFDVVIGGVISASFIPIFNDILTKENKKEATRFANKFITMIILVTLIIAAVGILFAPQLVSFMAPNFNEQTHDLTVKLASVMFPMIMFTGIAFSFVGILQSYGEYNIPSIISLVSNAAIIVYFVIFGKKFGVMGLSVTMIIAWSLQVIVQIPSLVKFKFCYRPDFRLRDKHILNAVLLALPMLVSTWVQPLYTFVNARFASHMQGAYSSLEYANRLYIIVTGVCSFVVTNLIFPKLSRANAGNNREEANALVMTSLKAVIIVIAPLMMGIMILSRPITAIIYEHGAFENTEIVAHTLACYAVGMIFLAANEVLSKAFFSMKHSITPMVTSIISMIFNIILVTSINELIKNDAASLTGGLALAAAGGSMVNAVLNAFMLFKRCPGMLKKQDAITVIKVIAASAVMAAAVKLAYNFISIYAEGFVGNILICIVCGGLGVVIYAAMVVLLRVNEIIQIFSKKKD